MKQKYNSISGNFDLIGIDESSSLLSATNEIRVKQNPGYGEFGDIASALASISGNSATNRYIIRVFPGEYTEPELDFAAKPYVSLIGSSIQSVVIKPSSSSHHLFRIGALNEISFVWIEDVGLGYAGIAMLDSGDYGQCHKITFNNCDMGILVESVTQDTYFYGEYIDMNGDFTHAIRMISNNGFECYANLENFYSFPENPNPSRQHVYLSGTTVECYINACGIKGTNDGTGFYVQNGAELNFNSGYISHVDIGLQNGNVGSAAIIILTATEFHQNITKDIEILHPSTLGSFSGTSTHVLITNQSPNFVWLFLDGIDGELDATKRISITFDDGTHTDLSTLLFEGGTMGSIEGGNLTDGGGLNVDVSAGFGYLDDNNIIKRYDWVASTVALTANSDNFIFISELGTLTASIATPTTLYNVIYLGRVRTHSTGIEFTDSSKMDSHHIGNLLSTFNRVALGNIYVSGSTITEGTALKLDVTQGLYFRSEIVFFPSGGSDIIFTQYHHNGSSAWVRTSTDTVNNTHYNNGNTYTTLTAGYFTKHALYTIGQGINEQYFLVLGQAEYSSLLLAQSGSLPTPPTYFDKGVTLIGLIYVQEGVGNIVSIDDARPVIGFKPITLSGSSDHSSLLNLNADDHNQYVLTAGGRTMTGNLDLGTNSIINVNLVDGVNVSAHASRHLPNGADPLTTAVPVNISSSNVNAEGIQNSFSRSDHTHAITANSITNASLAQVTTETFKGRTTAGTGNLEDLTIAQVKALLGLGGKNEVYHYAFNISPGAVTVPTVAAATTVIQSSITGLIAIQYSGTANQNANLTVRVPTDYLSGGRFKFLWSTSATSANTIRFAPILSVKSVGDSLITQTEVLTPQVIAAGTINLQQETGFFTPVTSLTAGQTLILRISRLATDATDTFTGKMLLNGVVFEYDSSK